jgi:hypothetical protein
MAMPCTSRPTESYVGATLNAKGVVEAPTNRPAGLDCYGKTLDELRQNGRIMEFQRRSKTFFPTVAQKRRRLKFFGRFSRRTYSRGKAWADHSFYLGFWRTG